MERSGDLSRAYTEDMTLILLTLCPILTRLGELNCIMSDFRNVSHAVSQYGDIHMQQADFCAMSYDIKLKSIINLRTFELVWHMRRHLSQRMLGSIGIMKYV